MGKRLPAPRAPQHARVIHYIDPSTQGQLTRYGPVNPVELARQEQRNRELYLRWKTRQAEIKERDAKARRFWLGFGAIIAFAVLAGLTVVAWLVWQFFAAISLGVLAVPAVVLLVALLGVGGHRCITVVQHWH